MKLKSLVVTAFALLLSFTAYGSDTTKVDFSKKRTVKTINLILPKEQTVVLRGVFTPQSVGQVMTKMKEIAATKKDIYLVLNSPGGSVIDGEELISLIQTLKKVQGIRTTCVVESMAYSMGALTALYCNQTFMQKHSSIMFHSASYSVQGSAPQIYQRVMFLTNFFDELNQDIANQMGITKEQYVALLSPEYWKTATEAAELGIVDGVVDSLYYTSDPTEDHSLDFFGNAKSGNIVISPLFTSLFNE